MYIRPFAALLLTFPLGPAFSLALSHTRTSLLPLDKGIATRASQGQLFMSVSTKNSKYDGWIARSFHSDSKQKSQQSSSNPETPDNKQDYPQKKLLDNNKKFPTRLVLHLDINETILLGDDAGGDSTSDSIQKMLAKSAFCQIPTSSSSDDNKRRKLDWDSTQELEPTHWWDGQKIGHESSMPPLYTGWEWPPNACPYYRTKWKKYSKEFVCPSTEEKQGEESTKEAVSQPHHGEIYKPIWEECQKMLSTVDSNSPAAEASMKRHPHLLPAFYHILDYLQELQQQSTSPPPILVFRTFGTDIEKVTKWVTEYAKEQNCPWLELGPEKLFQGRWKELDEDDSKTLGEAVYQLWDLTETKVVAKNEEEILQLLNSGTIFGIRDDYDFWKKYDWLPTAGKPVWIPSTPTTENGDAVFCHHLLFDDNIHNLPDDGIACIRQQEATPESKFTTIDAAMMHGGEYQGIHLKRVPTIEPVLNLKWYIEQIEHSRLLLQEKLTKTVSDDVL